MKFLVYLLSSILISCFNEVRPLTWSNLVQIEGYTLYSKTECDEILYATNIVNVRNQPKADATKLGFIQTGDAIRVTAKTDNGWYEVLYEGNMRGYIKADYLTSIKAGLPIQYDGIFYYTGDVSEEYLIGVVNSWYKIPDVIRESFISDGSKIIVTDEHLGTRFYNDSSKSLLGVTSFYSSRSNCEIYISINDKTYNAILHEIGHYIDGKLDIISSSDFFENVWELEASNINLFYTTATENIATPREYFAECCNLYILQGEDLKLYCPLSYEFVDEYYRRFTESET